MIADFPIARLLGGTCAAAYGGGDGGFVAERSEDSAFHARQELQLAYNSG